MTNRIFSLDHAFKDPLQAGLFSIVKGPVEHVLAFPRMNRVYADITRMKDSRSFPDKVLDRLNVRYDIAGNDGSRITIPAGPLIVVANHPFGGIEAMILASILCAQRRDVKFMANHLLNAIPEMRELLIPVNPFQQKNAVNQNIKPVRESIQWVKNGGLLVIFPAGAVSHFDLRKGAILDPEWSPGIARIIRKTGSPVLPVFFPGANSAAFHLAGMVHPMLRTAMLPNEQLNKGSRKIQVRVGEAIPFDKLAAVEQDRDLMEFLRLRTYLLELRQGRDAARRFTILPGKKHERPAERIMTPRNPGLMCEEIHRLAPSQTLAESGDCAVIQAAADQIPELLLEIGRLRELTFRAVGEGTGKAADIDRFDRTYLHLFIWNRVEKELVGAYRLGRTDELVNKYGAKGLYTSTLFHYKPGFIERLGPALEMGRSFVRPEYQKSYQPLLLLWKGIGRFVVDNPHYRTLFGPVSISNDYQPLSKQLIVRFLETARYRDDRTGLVKARKPLHAEQLRKWDLDAAVRIIKDSVGDIDELVSSVETDRKGIPILLKQYLKLGGRIAGFNVDPAFGNALDGLIVVDLAATEPRMLERYMGKDGLRHFQDYQAAMNRDRHADCA